MERRMVLTLLRNPKHFLRGYFQGENEFLFDLESDPKEQNNLVKERPGVSNEYREILADWQQRNEEIKKEVGGARKEYRENEQIRKHLEELGYL
jgi:hypothetical protein